MHAADLINSLQTLIHQDFHCHPERHLLTHVEEHGKGITSSFSIRASCKMLAFSMDKRGLNPFPIFNAGVADLCNKNDLTIICPEKGEVYVFVLEYKNSPDPGNAQHQIECGMAFCEYLFKLFAISSGYTLPVHMFGIAAYRPPPRGAKGTTNPRIKFSKVGKREILRANWLIQDQPLPMSDLLTAAQQYMQAAK